MRAYSADENLVMRLSTISRVALFASGTTVILIMTSATARRRPRSGSQRLRGFTLSQPASRDACPRDIADLRNRLRVPLNAELLYSAEQCSGIEVQQGRRALGPLDSPVGSHQHLQDVIAFYLFDALRRR